MIRISLNRDVPCDNWPVTYTYIWHYVNSNAVTAFSSQFNTHRTPYHASYSRETGQRIHKPLIANCTHGTDEDDELEIMNDDEIDGLTVLGSCNCQEK